MEGDLDAVMDVLAADALERKFADLEAAAA
jgi:hypothetical protein